MIKGFWEKLNKPIMVLAPMEDVTDNAFREVIARHGKPDVTFTEFTSADGICSEGRERVIHRFEYNESQRPIVAQIFSKFPEKVYQTAVLCRELGFDGIDINMGCPDKNVCKQGCGSAMIRTPDLAIEIIKAAQEGAKNIPVSVKTRIGYSQSSEMESWVKTVLSTQPAALTLHARTKKQMSKVPADWTKIAEAVVIRNHMGSETLIIGNGDVKSTEEAHERIHQTKADGVMIGRGIYGNPWLFNKAIKKQDLSIREVLTVLSEHINLYEEYFSTRKNFIYMRKHFKSYIAGFENTKELKVQLLESNSIDEARNIISEFLRYNEET